MDFKDRLEEALIARGMTKAELARRAGIDKGAITKYMKGENLPGSDAVMKMAKALSVRPGWLIGGDGDIDELIYTDSEVLLEYNQLTEANQALTKAYIKGLLDSQKGDR